MTSLPQPSPGLDGATTVLQILRRRAQRTPAAVGRWSLDKTTGQWCPTTWLSIHDEVRQLAWGLRRLGLKPSSRVGLMASTSAQWDDCSMAVMAARGVVVGIDAHATAVQVQAKVRASKLDALIVESDAMLELFDPVWRDALPWVVVIGPAPADQPPVVARRLSMADLSALGRARAGDGWDQSQAGDDALVIFTSGTTGEAKAISYRHDQVCLAVEAIIETFEGMGAKHRVACWLPLSNLFQRIVNFCAIVLGVQTYYVADPREIMTHLPRIRPHVFIGVPRFFDKFHQGILRRVGQGGRLARTVGQWALRVGQAHADMQRRGMRPPLTLRISFNLARVLVIKRISKAIGGELKYFVSGSAPMAVTVLEGLHGMGFPVLEAYGLSECIVPIAANTPRDWRVGSVGRPLHGIETRIAADGELLIRNNGVFSGYLDGAGRDTVVDADGFLATGDLAEFDSDGFLRLVGRKSEIFKTSTGRRVSPAEVEAVLTQVPGVEFAAVFGSGRKSLTAVVSVSGDAPGDTTELRAKLLAGLSNLPPYLRPAGVAVTRRLFSMETGELTPNLKLRRKQVGQRYAAILESLNAALDASTDEPWHATGDRKGEQLEIMSL